METIITTSEIIEYFRSLGMTVVISGNGRNRTVIGPGSIDAAGDNRISFLTSKYKDKATSLLTNSKAALVVVESNLYNDLSEADKGRLHPHIVLSDHPKKVFVDCLHNYFREIPVAEIHPTALIHPEARLGGNVSVGPYAVIEKSVTIGNDCVIGAHTHIMKGCTIGNRVIIRSNVTIGNWGFGFVKNESGHNINFPHYGGVLIEDDVQIGSSTCVDRGTLGDTIIKKGVKIDNLVHVAHNVVIGEHSLVIACTMIGGSTEIGDNCWVAPAVILRNGIRVGANTTLGMGCIVTKDIPENATVTGSPAMPLEDFKKLMKAQKKLLNDNG